jgi:hypothetical protein
MPPCASRKFSVTEYWLVDSVRLARLLYDVGTTCKGRRTRRLHGAPVSKSRAEVTARHTEAAPACRQSGPLHAALSGHTRHSP